MKFHFTKIYFLILIFSFPFLANAQSVQKVEERSDIVKQANILWAKGEYDKAIILYEKILEDNPDQNLLYENLIKAYAYLGMFETAKKRANELYGQNPDNPMMIGGEYCRLALINTMQGNNEKALKAVDAMAKVMNPAMVFPGAPTCSFMFQTKAGKYEAAWANLDKLLKVKDAGLWRNLFLLYGAYVKEKLGEKEKSEQLLSELEKNINIMHKSGAMEAAAKEVGAEFFKVMADYYAYIGEKGKALSSLQQHYEVGGKQYYWIKFVSPFLTKLEGTPQFVAILDKMKKDIVKMRGNVEAQQL